MRIFAEALTGGIELIVSGAVDVWTIIVTSLTVSGSATALALLLGVPIGYALGSSRTVGRTVALVAANAGMGLPPVAVGLIVAMALSRRGPFGGLGLLYTKTAMVAAQVVIAVPVVVAVTAAAVAAVPRELRLQARSLGASPLHELALTLSEARMGLFAAVAAGFGAVISEVGAVQMVGGNLEGETRVLTTAIVQYTRMGRYAEATALTLVLLAIVVAVNVLITAAQTSADRYAERR